MDINLTLSPAAIPINWLVVAIYKASSPMVVEAYQSFPAPHVTPQDVTFTGVDPEVYYVKTYESVDGTPAGTLRHDFIYDPSFQVAEIREDLFLQVGITPGMVAGTTTYDDVTLDGWTYSIELRQSYGTLQPTVDWDYTATGWKLLMPDYVFQPEEVYVLRFYPKITTFTPIVQTANLFSNYKIVTTDEVLLPADIGKVILIQGASTSLTITLPLVADIIALKPICLISNGGSHINANIVTQGGDVVQMLNSNLSTITMGQSEQLWLMLVDTYYTVPFSQGGFNTVGQIVNDYVTNRLNTIFAAGQLLSRATYSRLWAYVQTLDASMLVSDANWSNVVLNNKSRYSTGDGATTFRAPLLYEQGFLRGVDGVVRKAGSKEVDSVIEHQHFLFGDDNDGGQYPTVFHSTGGNLGYTIFGCSDVPTFFKTGKFGDTETKPKNSAVYFLINI